jgi:chemotaxis protein histidine kinase CheA
VPVKFEGQVHAVICLHECDRFRDWASDEAEFAQRVGRQLGLSLANLRLLDSARNAAAEAAPHLAKMELRVAELEREVAQLREAAAHANNAAAAARAAESEARAAEALARAGEADARNSEAQARAVIERLRGAEAEARAAAEAAARSEAEARRERDELREDEARARRSAQQLLEINRLKSDFIVNAGRELEASLQSLLGFADQVSQGLYGPLTAEQAQGVRNIVAWARRMSSDVEWLIEYGSTRSRRLETGEGDQSQTTQVAG